MAEIEYQLIELNEGILLADDLLSIAEVRYEYNRIKDKYLKNHTEEQFYTNFNIKVKKIYSELLSIYDI